MTTLIQLPVEAKSNNLLKNKWIRAFMRSRWYPGIIQWPTLIVFMFIMFELLLGPEVAHDNFGTALTWVLWWPLIPIIFLFLGRFWCAICPFATINDLVQKFAGNNRPVPKFLKKYGIWIIDALFIFVTWSYHVFGVVENPVGSAVFSLAAFGSGARSAAMSASWAGFRATMPAMVCCNCAAPPKFAKLAPLLHAIRAPKKRRAARCLSFLKQ